MSMCFLKWRFIRISRRISTAHRQLCGFQSGRPSRNPHLSTLKSLRMLEIQFLPNFNIWKFTWVLMNAQVILFCRLDTDTDTVEDLKQFVHKS